MSAGIPVDVLERQAAEQRRQLHNSVIELRQSVKEKLDVKRTAREHLWPAAGGLALVGLLLGYGLSGVFIRD